MGLLLLEALAVLGIAIFIVWWTMFSGRGKADAAPPRADDPRLGGPGDTRAASPDGNGAADSAGTKPGAD